MKKLQLIFLFSTFAFITDIKAQLPSYNIYEINKGEILKKDYFHIEYLFDNYYAATIKKDGLSDYLFTDLTGIIDDSENMILPFQYRNILPVWDQFNSPKKTYIQISNMAEGRLLGLYEIKGKNEVVKIIDNYVAFRYFLFNKTCISAYSGYYDIYNLNTGNTIKTEFVELYPLTDELIATKDMAYKWGISDRNGHVIFRNTFDEIRNLTDSNILLKKNDSIGAINHNGGIIIPPVFKSLTTNTDRIFAQTFNTGKPITLSEELKLRQSNFTLTIESGKQSKKYYSYDDYDNIKQSGLSGAFDKNGKLVIPFEYEILEAGIGKDILALKNNKFGVLSRDGKLLIDHKYDNIEPYFEKFYVTKVDNKFGLIDNESKEILPPVYSKIFPISGLAVLVLEDTQWHKLWYDENLTLQKQKLEFNSSYSFYIFSYYSSTLKKTIHYQDYFQIMRNGKHGIMSKDLSVIIPPLYDDATYREGQVYFELKKAGKGTYFNLQGKELKNITSVISLRKNTLNNTLICVQNSKYGVIDTAGNIIIPFEYKEISDIDGKRFIVKK